MITLNRASDTAELRATMNSRHHEKDVAVELNGRFVRRPMEPPERSAPEARGAAIDPRSRLNGDRLEAT